MKNRKPRTAKQTETLFSFLKTMVAILIALIISFVLIFLVSDEPWAAMSAFLLGPFERISRIGYIVEKMIPLLFTGTAICIMYSAGQINVGGEGVFYLSGVVAAALSTKLVLPAGLHPAVCILAGGLVGALICGLIAVFHVKFGAMTLVTSLMFNYVCLWTGSYFINNALRDVSAGFNTTFPYAETAKLSKLFSKTDIHSGLFLAILAVVLGYVLLYKTKWGYNYRMIGKNLNFARYAGINVVGSIIGCQLVGGFLAGVGGSVEQLGMYNRFIYNGLSGHGFDGVVVAVIALLNPKYVPISAFFLAYINVGAEVMSRVSDVPTEVVSVIQALIIVFIAAERFLAGWKHKAIVRSARAQLGAGGEV